MGRIAGRGMAADRNADQPPGSLEPLPDADELDLSARSDSLEPTALDDDRDLGPDGLDELVLEELPASGRRRARRGAVRRRTRP
jgi:hypothetical protein